MFSRAAAQYQFGCTMLTRPSFAMLTSKPPFQSSTTDEIYRRARERDYEWPSSDTSNKYISREAKDLVAIMLQDAERRPEPDSIVEHPFFTSGYLPAASDMTSKLREVPPDNICFYEPLRSAQQLSINTQHVQDMCRECGVGPWRDAQLVFKKTWREMAEEETHGLTPIIPLAEGIVYRPFDEVRGEQKLESRRPLPQQGQQSRQLQMSQLSDKNDEQRSLTQAALPPRTTTSLRAPPRSFAAQQRAQGRLQGKALIDVAPSRTQTVADVPVRPAGTVRSRSVREPEPVEAQAPITNPISSKLGRVLRNHTTGTATRGQRKVSATEEPAKERGLATRVPEQFEARQTVRGDSSLSLFASWEQPEQVPGTQPDVVLDRLRKLQTELERALNARTMAFVSAKEKTPTPPHIVVKWVDYTNKFGLGYVLSNGSVGCILRNFAVEEPVEGLMPPACLLVHGAEWHFMRKYDETYADRGQVVPMTEDVLFYEINGEEGISCLRVPPKTFKLVDSGDGSGLRLLAGKDTWDQRKRERLVLWKKFINYMIAYGKELDPSAARAAAMSELAKLQAEKETGVSPATSTTGPPSDLVTFYQRFGDVGCWMFGDGHFQVNSSPTLLHVVKPRHDEKKQWLTLSSYRVVQFPRSHQSRARSHRHLVPLLAPSPRRGRAATTRWHAPKTRPGRAHCSLLPAADVAQLHGTAQQPSPRSQPGRLRHPGS
jgi:hypothetical protein